MVVSLSYRWINKRRTVTDERADNELLISSHSELEKRVKHKLTERNEQKERNPLQILANNRTL